jgi:hypothetical protein
MYFIILSVTQLYHFSLKVYNGRPDSSLWTVRRYETLRILKHKLISPLIR